jgi:hypothetical protein
MKNTQQGKQEKKNKKGSKSKQKTELIPKGAI